MGARAPLYMERLYDGPDALPVGQARPDYRDVSGIPATVRRVQTPIGFGIPADAELYRTRTQPELYPEWLVESVHTHRASFVDSIPMEVWDWDCHACKRAVITAAMPGIPCPNCGA